MTASIKERIVELWVELHSKLYITCVYLCNKDLDRYEKVSRLNSEMTSYDLDRNKPLKERKWRIDQGQIKHIEPIFESRTLIPMIGLVCYFKTLPKNILKSFTPMSANLASRFLFAQLKNDKSQCEATQHSHSVKQNITSSWLIPICNGRNGACLTKHFRVKPQDY